MLSEIVFAKSQLNATGYQEILHSKLLPFMIETEDKKYFFKRKPLQKRWFRDFAIELLTWTVLSADLKTIVNLRGILV